jgi:3-dehydroquinate dehydratase-1
MKYNLCIPIPIRSASIEEVKPIIDKAIRSKPNLIELRFDYISSVKILSMELLKKLSSIIQPHNPVIFTFRDYSQGGQIQINQDQCLKIYNMFIKVKPNYIDLEMNTDNKILDEIINLAYQNSVKLIFSYHNFENTLSFNEATDLIHKFNTKLIQELSLDSEKFEGIINKVVFTAQNFEDNIIPLRLCRESSNAKKIISFCMGPLGIFSRITCVLAGSFLTYTFLEEQTAKGQINIEKMKEVYELILD